MEWFSQNFNDTVHPVQDVLAKVGAQPEVLSLPTEASLQDIEAEFRTRLAYNAASGAQNPALAGGGVIPQEQVSTAVQSHLVLLGSGSLVASSGEELHERIRKYYDAVVMYFGDRSNASQNSAAMNSSISFVRSLYVLGLILFRSRAKDPANVLQYIVNGSYKKIAMSLAVVTADLVFDISPVTDGLENLCQNLNTTSLGPVRIAYFLIGTYCGLRDGIAVNHPVSDTNTIPDELVNPLRPDGLPAAYQSFVNLLEGGCMLHLRYKGLPIIRIIEEISRKIGLDTCTTTDKLATTVTQGTCMSIMLIVQSYAAYWGTTQNVPHYHPAETTWRYSKNLSDNVFLEMSNKDNIQFHYRVASILAKTTNMEISRIASISSYNPSAADSAFIEKAGAKLFGSAWTETEVNMVIKTTNIIFSLQFCKSIFTLKQQVIKCKMIC